LSTNDARFCIAPSPPTRMPSGSSNNSALHFPKLILTVTLSSIATQSDESARTRSPFRHEADQRSAVKPITIPD
jgi:hypothetical protein